MSDSKQKKKAGAGCAVLFGLPFFLVGLGVLIFGLAIPTFTAIKSNSWPTAQGTLIRNTITSHSSSDGTSYSLDMQVEFTHNGETYITENTNVYPIKSGGRSSHEKMKKILDLQVSKKGTVTVWVDESNPTKSVVDPGIAWKFSIFLFIFGLIFGGVGFALIISPLFKKKETLQESGVISAESIPQKIRSGIPGKIWGYLIIGFLFLGMGSFVVIQSFEELEKENYWILIAYLFPLGGLWCLILAIKTWFAFQKFGSIEITLDPHPPCIGGDVAGSMPVNIPYDMNNEFKVSLGCFRRSRQNNKSNSDDSGYGKPLWLEEGVAKSESSVRGTHLRFGFAIPKDATPTTTNDQYKYTWQLFLKADLPGLDLDREIEIPVADYLEDPPSPKNKVIYSRENARIEKHVELPRNKVRMGEETDGSPSFFFPASRNRGGGIALTIVSLIFLGSGIGVGYFAGLKRVLESTGKNWFDLGFAFIPTIMGAIFVLIGLLLFFLGLSYLFTSIKLVIDHNGTLVVTKRFLIFPKTNIYPLSTLTHLERSSDSSSSNGNGKPTIHYKLSCMSGGKKLRLADGLTGTQLTDAVEERLRAALVKGGAKL